MSALQKKTLVYVDGHTEDVIILFTLEMCYVVLASNRRVVLVSRGVVKNVVPYVKRQKE
jgi:hypothetical protein